MAFYDLLIGGRKSKSLNLSPARPLPFFSYLHNDLAVVSDPAGVCLRGWDRAGRGKLPDMPFIRTRKTPHSYEIKIRVVVLLPSHCR